MSARVPDLVSIIMPVYRGERFVAAAIESVLAQTYRPFELVIVNDGSPDASASEIARFLPHPQIRYVEQQNAGVANARNTGLANGTGAFIALLDQDDIWLPDKLKLQVAFLNARLDVGMVHTRVECIDAEGKPRPCEGAIWIYPFQGFCAGRMLLGSAIAPATVLVRRSCIDDVGPFDQNFAPADDWELWIRIARSYPIGFLDEVTARYRFHGENVSKDPIRMQLAALKTMDAICRRFPDVAKSVSATELAIARSRALCWAAEALEARGQRAEARSYWKEAYRTTGDLDELLALLGMPAVGRGRLLNAVDKMPRFRRVLTWYVYKIVLRFLTPSDLSPGYGTEKE